MENRAAAGRVTKVHRAAEPSDDLLDDAQTEAGAAVYAGVRGVRLREFLEDTGLEAVGNAVAVVPHRDTDISATLLDRDHHFLVWRREFDRIREQIGDDLDQPIGIAAHFAGFRRGIEPNPHAVTLGESAIGLNRLHDQRTNLDSFENEDDLAGFDLLHFENAVDQPDKPLAVRVRDRDQTYCGTGQGSTRITDQQPERARDRGQRCAQFVADRRDELVLQALDAIALTEIDDHAENQRASARLNRIKADLDGKLSAVLAPTSKIAAGSRPAAGMRSKLSAVLGMPGAQIRGQEDIDGLTEHLVASVAEQPFHFRIDKHDISGAVDHHDADRAGLDRHAKYFFRLHFRVRVVCKWWKQGSAHTQILFSVVAVRSRRHCRTPRHAIDHSSAET